MLFSNNWKGAGGTAWFIVQLYRTTVVQLLSASALQTTYDAFLALQFFLQQKISSKTVAEKLISHPSLSILAITPRITHIN